MTRFCRRHRSNSRGLALPLAILVVTVLGIIAFGVVFGFSRQTNFELATVKIDNKYQAPVYAGVRAADFSLRRPDSSAGAHQWTADYSATSSLDVNGVTVHIKIEDIEEPL